MSLAFAVTSALPYLRSEANAMMLTEGVVRRATGNKITDPDTYEEVDEFAVIYSGRCKVRMPVATDPNTGVIPGQVAVKDKLFLSLPIGADGAADLAVDDVWECTANPTDPSLVGAKLRVMGGHHQTFATAHRYPVEEVS